MRHSLLTSAICLALLAPLGACSALREGAGSYEKVAAKNEAGQLIQPNAPTEGQVSASTDRPVEGSAVRGATQVADIEQAAKNLPRGLAGDTANQQHIGEAIPPR